MRKSLIQPLIKKGKYALEADTIFFYDNESKTFCIDSCIEQFGFDNLPIDNNIKRFTSVIKEKKDRIRKCEPFIFSHTDSTIIAVSIKIEKRCFGLLCCCYEHIDDIQMETIAVNLFAKQMLLELINLDIKRQNKLLMDKSDTELIKLLVSTMEFRDSYTRGHSERVALYSKAIGIKIGLDEPDINNLYASGLFHDLGKVGIPDMILLKPGKLSQSEFNIIKLHPIISADIISSMSRFSALIPAIKYHHERWDGTGYPNGLKGENIPYCARILAIADVIDAVTTVRPYRDAFSVEKTRSLLIQEQGSHFDPEIASIVLDRFDLFMSSVREEKTVYTQLSTSYPELDIWRSIFFDIDFKTGFLMRDSFIKGIATLKKESRPFRLFLIDLVDLKEINYKNGIEAGDKVLMDTVDSINKLQINYRIRKLARNGGDSFVFILLKEDIGEEYDLEIISYRIQETLRKTGIKLYIAVSDFPEDPHPLFDAEKKLKEIKRKREY